MIRIALQTHVFFVGVNEYLVTFSMSRSRTMVDLASDVAELNWKCEQKLSIKVIDNKTHDSSKSKGTNRAADTFNAAHNSFGSI